MLEEGHPQEHDKQQLSDKVDDKARLPCSLPIAPVEGAKEGKMFHIAGTFPKLVSLLQDASKYRIILFHFD